MATWTPTPEQIKALIPQRVGGGPFTASTVPSTAQVTSLALQVSEEIIGEIGAAVPAGLEGQATWVASLGTAAYIEQSFFPEQQIGDETPGQLLYTRYLAALARLVAAVARTGVSTTTFGQIGTVRTPSATVADYIDLTTDA